MMTVLDQVLLTLFVCSAYTWLMIAAIKYGIKKGMKQ